MEEKLKVGVWVEDGVVLRRESQKCPNARTYTPKSPEHLDEVLQIVELLQSYYEMPSWTAQIEYEIDQEVQKIEKIAFF